MWDKAIAFHIELGIRDNMDSPLHTLYCLDFMQRPMKVQRKLKGPISQSDNPWSYGASQPLNSDIRSIIAEDFSSSNLRLDFHTWIYKMVEFQVFPFITAAEIRKTTQAVVFSFPHWPKWSWMSCSTMALGSLGRINRITWWGQYTLLSFIIGPSIPFKMSGDQRGQLSN